MKHFRSLAAPRARRQLAQLTQQTSLRRYATEPSPPPPPPPPAPQQSPTSPARPNEPSRVGTYYKSFGSPVLKCFLGALFTYQIVYYAWLKLEAAEETHTTAAEIQGLQQELRDAVAERAQGAGEMLGRAVEGVERKLDGERGEKPARKGGWFW